MKKVSEPLFAWGGNWTEKKLEAFENYVNAYQAIMNSQKQKYKGCRLQFILMVCRKPE